MDSRGIAALFLLLVACQAEEAPLSLEQALQVEDGGGSSHDVTLVLPEATPFSEVRPLLQRLQGAGVAQVFVGSREEPRLALVGLKLVADLPETRNELRLSRALVSVGVGQGGGHDACWWPNGSEQPVGSGTLSAAAGRALASLPRVERSFLVVDDEALPWSALVRSASLTESWAEEVSLAWRQPRPRGGPCLEWVTLPAGEFLMGSDDGYDDEKPVHKVTLRSFQLTKSEVTMRQYRACVEAGACSAPH